VLAREGLDAVRRLVALAGYAEEAHLEVLPIGLVAQQMSNDPGGDRFIWHLDEVFGMCWTTWSRRRERRRG
jgi:hypothetical protein